MPLVSGGFRTLEEWKGDIERMEHTPLSMEFHEMGGYDCTSDAWDIKTGTRTLFVIDEADYPEPIEARVIASNVIKACNYHDELVKALTALFEHCAMIHKHWGEGSNQHEADTAIAKAKAILQRIEKGE
jgi:hypothetical protein